MERSALMIEEQETHINWSRGDARAQIYTSDVTTMTKLDKLVSAKDTEWKLEKEYREKDGRVHGKFYSCPVVLISFRTKGMSEEQRKILADQAREKFTRENAGNN